MKKQLVICTDMEGVSGIFDDNWKEFYHGSEEWKKFGREKITSDVLAACEAANEYGIDEILIYDGHFAGNPEHNIIIERLPNNTRFLDTENRCFDWRRIRGQAYKNPFGIITLGQHARYGEENAYSPHTIQSPPIKAFWCNHLNIAELGSAVISFHGTKYLANIGCQASMKEALELCQSIIQIPVKDKSKNWEPSNSEAFSIIKKGVMVALENHANARPFSIDYQCKFSLELVDGYYFEKPKDSDITWKGYFKDTVAYWEAPFVEMGLELFSCIRFFIKQKGSTT